MIFKMKITSWFIAIKYYSQASPLRKDKTFLCLMSCKILMNLIKRLSFNLFILIQPSYVDLLFPTFLGIQKINVNEKRNNSTSYMKIVIWRSLWTWGLKITMIQERKPNLGFALFKIKLLINLKLRIDIQTLSIVNISQFILENVIQLLMETVNQMRDLIIFLKVFILRFFK